MAVALSFVAIRNRVTVDRKSKPYRCMYQHHRLHNPSRNLSATVSAAADVSKTSPVLKAAELFTNLFPLWTVIVAFFAINQPSSFSAIKSEYFIGGLSLLMLAMVRKGK